jgi:hypothetical protein
MKDRVPYKDFVIEAIAHELQGDLGWSWDMFIEKHDGRGVTVTRFIPEHPAMHRTGESALATAVANGKKRIDDGFTC